MKNTSFEMDGQRSNTLRASRSNPDIAGHSVAAVQNNIAHYYEPVRSVSPEHVLKVYRADQSFKYLTVYKETTAQNVVQLALQVQVHRSVLQFPA